MKNALIAAIISLSFAPASAAPLWVERQLIPDAALIDPVFLEYAEEGGAVVEHGLWAKFLSSYLIVGGDGINRIAYAPAAADAQSLAAYVSSLEAVDVAGLTRPEQLAFWINLYNAATIRLILDHYPVDSIRDIDDPWGRPAATVGGRALSLNDIEHGIIRPVFRDPRIHYAVNCASVGCPNLAPEPYTDAAIEDMLTEAARDYVNHPRGIRVEKGKATASKIYGWYREDFGDGEAEILNHIRLYAAPDLLAQLRTLTKIQDYDYDWSLNDAEPQ